jgi:aspartate kinase
MSKETRFANGDVVAGQLAVDGEKEGQQLRWRNDSKAGWVVQKFGGTSVGKFAGKIADDIVRYVLCLSVFSIGLEKGSHLRRES